MRDLLTLLCVLLLLDWLCELLTACQMGQRNMTQENAELSRALEKTLAESAADILIAV